MTGSFRYRAYGTIAQTSGAGPNYLGYGGQLGDPSGLIYLRARWYDPATGRFLSRDPLVGDPAHPRGLNAFAYADANPVLRTDPTGKGAFICGAAIGLGAYALTIVLTNVVQGKGMSLEGATLQDAGFALATGALTQGASAFLAGKGLTLLGGRVLGAMQPAGLGVRVAAQGAISAASTVAQNVVMNRETDWLHLCISRPGRRLRAALCRAEARSCMQLGSALALTLRAVSAAMWSRNGLGTGGIS